MACPSCTFQVSFDVENVREEAGAALLNDAEY